MTRKLLRWLLPAFAGLCAAAAVAQTYPSQPIKLIVPYPPGGNTDIVARVFGQKLSERIGQPVVIDNRGGAAGALGMGIAAKSPNDGYTLVIGDLGSLVIGPIAKPDLGYNPQKDLAPISLVTSVSIVVSANPKSPISSFPDFLARARAQPGKLTVGTAGVGGPGHLALELLRSMTGIDVLHVPFKGGAQAIAGLLGEQVDLVIDGTAVAQVKAGRLKAIAVTGPRLPALPDTPGIGETVNGFNFTNWWGILAPAGAPAAAVSRLNQELTAIAALPEVRERLLDLGLSAQNSTPQQFAEMIRSETDKVARIVKDAAIKFE
ncbi:MAG: tripartite tricarboxylate transporter substrate-binding protein [Betaproteobacteria bacterium]|nr:tripartite tricarboxylate transporter substrate-binding protein [Betaproteobacteria bacterium]